MTDLTGDKAVMIDIETCDTAPGGVVLSLGLLVFDRDKLNTYEELRDNNVEILFNTVAQVEAGCTVSQKTMDWWAQQGDAARRVLDPPAEAQIHPRDFFTFMENNVGNNYALRNLRWYARGPSFDMALLEAMLKKFNVSPPWKYGQVRDTRTVYDEHNIEYTAAPLPDIMVAHNAADDAAWDAWMLQRAWNDAPSLINLIEKAKQDEQNNSN